MSIVNNTLIFPVWKFTFVFFSLTIREGGIVSVVLIWPMDGMFCIKSSGVNDTDYVNNRIVLYDDQGDQKEELKIDHHPTDITKVNDLTVAVATLSTKVYLVDPNYFLW
jgi:hypothetical protein